MNRKKLCGTNQNLDPGEECDDDNQIGGDGCNAGCQIERGYRCVLDDADNISDCAPITGRCGNSNKECTLSRPCTSGAQCIFSQPVDACVPGKASFCQNGKEIKCASGNICLGGKCQPEKAMTLNFVNNFNPSLETIIFVPGLGSGSPNQFRGISDEYGDRFNIAYFPYELFALTEDVAGGLNEAVIKILNLNRGYDKKIKLVSHSNGHLIVRTAILQANGYTKSGQIEKNNRLEAVYARAEFYSVAGVIGGSDYARIVPVWPTNKYGELNPIGPFQNWLFSEDSVKKFNSAIGGYHSFDATGDPHLKSLADCKTPSFLQGWLPQWCANYNRGISDDHRKFNPINENLMSDNHPGFSDVEAETMLSGLKTG